MHIPLRERNADILGIKALLDGFVEVEEKAPVVSGIHPGAHVEVDTAVI